MTTRIYNVFDGKTDRLIRAGNPAQALRHVAKASFTVRVATQDDLVDVVGRGGKVEDASKEEDAE
jgi:hypothetical protein